VSALPNVIDSDENLVTQTSLLSQSQCMGYGQSNAMSHATANGTQSKLTNVAKTTTASASISSNSLEMPHHTREPINVMDAPIMIGAEQSQRISPPLIPSVTEISSSQMWADYSQRSSTEKCKWQRTPHNYTKLYINCYTTVADTECFCI